MSRRQLTCVLKDYDYLAPLACGDIKPEGFELDLQRDTPRALERTLHDPAVEAGELSFSRHVIRLADGDRSFVGIPFFAYRAFRHRWVFVRRGSGLVEFRQLAGRRVGTNEWPASGNVWSRALLRRAGVEIDQVQWLVGPVDDPAAPRRPQGDLPPYVQLAPEGRPLREMLLAGEIDALMCPNPPRGFYEPDSPVVRLVPDYRRAEQQYYRETGIYPPQHIVGLRRVAFERQPELARRLFEALDRSRLVWQERRRVWSEFSPWLLAEIEETTALLGEDWQPNGLAPNRVAIQAFCDELLAQKLIARPVSPEELFAEFEEVA